MPTRLRLQGLIGLRSKAYQLPNGLFCAQTGPSAVRDPTRGRLNILHHTGERHAMECAAICFNVCIAAVLLIFAPAKSPQRVVQLYQVNSSIEHSADDA